MGKEGISGDIRDRILQKLRKNIDDLKGVILIGSRAEGNYEDDSDVNLVCLLGEDSREKRAKLRTMGEELSNELGIPVDLIPSTSPAISVHFEKGTILAHAIKRGIPLVDVDGFFSYVRRKPMNPPDLQWLKDYFQYWLNLFSLSEQDYRLERKLHKKYCRNVCYCGISNLLAKVLFNFVIIYLATKKLVTTTRKEAQSLVRLHINNSKVLEGLEIAFQACHERRPLNLNEAQKVMSSAKWFKKELGKTLNINLK
jgi:predicted nucleotidyltransferase